MPGDEFDVDASIAAGWSRFTDHLADLLRAAAVGESLDLAVPVPDPPRSGAPYIRLTRLGDRLVRATLPADADLDPTCRLSPAQESTLVRLGWRPEPGDGHRAESAVEELTALVELVARTLTEVFALPHPAFLHDAGGHGLPAGGPGSATTQAPPSDDADFLPTLVDDPDTATRAIGAALAQVFDHDVPADDHDVFAVPVGRALLFVRAHRSLPLVVFRSPLVADIRDPRSAESEVATLNRESLWCRYVFDGHTIHAESEFVDRVFVPVNFKIKLAEIAAELGDVDRDLARRVGGRRWIDRRATDGTREVEP